MSYTKQQRQSTYTIATDVEGSRTGSKKAKLSDSERTKLESRIIEAVLQELDQLEKAQGRIDDEAHVEGHINFTKKAEMKSITK